MKIEMRKFELPFAATRLDFDKLQAGGDAMLFSPVTEVDVRNIRTRLKSYQNKNEGQDHYSQVFQKGTTFGDHKFDEMTLLVWRIK